MSEQENRTPGRLGRKALSLVLIAATFDGTMAGIMGGSVARDEGAIVSGIVKD